MVAVSAVSMVLAVLLATLLGPCHAASLGAFDIVPNSPGWVELMQKRDAQIQQMQVSQERWDASVNHLYTCCLMPNFTETGFKVVPMPAKVHERLLTALRNDPRRSEGPVDQISGDVADFVNIGQLGFKIMEELRPMHEDWANLPRGGLQLSNAYGLRLYKPGNTLTMHTDHSETHVISSILHVDRDVDVPWPIVIEGFDGRTHEVDLKPGEMLLYESAKCNHGRPRPMVGRWYTSLFIHYKPVDAWDFPTSRAINIIEETNKKGLLPPGGWGRNARELDPNLPSLRMVGTGMKEPECENNWCSLARQWPPSETVRPPPETDRSEL